MITIIASKIAGDFYTCRNAFPFRFLWQASTRPTGESIGLVQADMTDRPVRVQCLLAMQREFGFQVGGPIEWMSPLLLFNRSPTVRQPQLGCLITVVVDKLPKLRVRNQAIGQAAAM